MYELVNITYEAPSEEISSETKCQPWNYLALILNALVLEHSWL